MTEIEKKDLLFSIEMSSDTKFLNAFEKLNLLQREQKHQILFLEMKKKRKFKNTKSSAKESSTMLTS